MICNAFRAIQHDPDAVAQWADYPTIHQDLTARRHWLADWRDANAARLSVDPLAYDAQAAGWWIWCVSSWIGGSGDMLRRQIDKRPHVHNNHGGRGVQVQRANAPGGLAIDQIPHVNKNPGGQGVQAQRMFTSLVGWPMTRPQQSRRSWGPVHGRSVRRWPATDCASSIVQWRQGVRHKDEALKAASGPATA